MGYIKHHAIVVTSDNESVLRLAHDKANAIFGEIEGEGDGLVSPVLCGVINQQYSFFVTPDGSKEGWEDSDRCNIARAQLIEYLKTIDQIDFVEVRFGGDDLDDKIVNSSADQYKSHD